MKLRSLLRSYKVQTVVPEPYVLFPPWLYEEPVSAILPHILAEIRPVRGFDLFAKVAAYRWDRTNRAAWKLLTDNQKIVFEHPPPEVDRHLHRIIHGYSSAVCSATDANPFYDTPLYPWEIIKDKLRMPWMGGADIYDSLILEALKVGRAQVTPFSLFASDADAMGFDGLLAAELRRMFHNLSLDEAAQYRARSDRKLQHCDRLREFRSTRKLPPNPFHAFFKAELLLLNSEDQQLPAADINRILGQKWKALTDSQRAQYNGVFLSPNCRFHRETVLDRQTELVMDYIFELGLVEDWAGDWRKWRAEVVGNMFYLDKMYFPYIVQRRAGKYELESKPAEFEELSLGTEKLKSEN